MSASPRIAGPGARALALALLLLGGSCAPVAAQPRVTMDGMFVTVPANFTDGDLRQVKAKVKDAIVRRGRAIETVVLDFNPDGAANISASFGLCSDLADWVRALTRGQLHGRSPKVIAFVHGQVAGHMVLPVLACGEIVMSRATDDVTNMPRARIGDVLLHIEGPLTPAQRRVYADLAQERFASPDLVLRLVEPMLPLRRVDTARGIRYASPERIKAWQAAERTIAVKSDIPKGLEPGVMSYDAVLASEVGLCRALANTRQDVQKALGLPPRSLTEDWLVGRQRPAVVWQIEVSQPLDQARLASLARRIHSAVGRGANCLVLKLNVGGGETAHVAALADELFALKDREGAYPIKKIAWVAPGVNLGAGTYLALACDEIVMGSNSTLADFNDLRGEGPELMRRRAEMLLPLARAHGYPEAPFEAALLHPNEGVLPPITAERAKGLGIAQATGIDSPEQLYRVYDLRPEDLTQTRVSRDDVLDRVAEFFRLPAVNVVLLVLGIIGLVLEFKMPGTTFPGAVAAICFVLFFWAYSFVGEFTLLAILLFLLGLFLLGVELFLVPGLGFSGIAGVALLLTSLVLVTLERSPETPQDWSRLGGTLTTLAISLTVALAGAIALVWSLPSLPYFNRMVLRPPGEDGTGEVHVTAVSPAPRELLGAIGVAATPLRPSGKAQFGEEFCDVIAEGDFVSPGARVQVVEIEGNRVVVKEV